MSVHLAEVNLRLVVRKAWFRSLFWQRADPFERASVALRVGCSREVRCSIFFFFSSKYNITILTTVSDQMSCRIMKGGCC